MNNLIVPQDDLVRLVKRLYAAGAKEVGTFENKYDDELTIIFRDKCDFETSYTVTIYDIMACKKRHFDIVEYIYYIFGQLQFISVVHNYILGGMNDD